MDAPIVFVLGAGFTRAFVPRAPLLVDDYNLTALVDRFAQFPYASAILEDAIAEFPLDRVDLERLMTRLGGMPYDPDDARHELALLESELRRSLVSRLDSAKASGVDATSLAGFARFVLTSGASIVTFNYDDVVDQSLWEVHRATSSFQTDPYWHPDGGYGFFCRPSSICVSEQTGLHMDRPKSLLLKLHGSVNWRSRLGEAASRGPAALLHHESWMPRRSQLQYEDREIESHLEPDAFIVPPVLEKAGLGLHPALRVIWAAAKQKLEKASTVIFIGYSLPQTDLAARTLFRETLGDRKCHVQVLDYSPNMHPKPTLVEAYRAVCRDIGEDCFDWGGAKARIESKFSRAPNA